MYFGAKEKVSMLSTCFLSFGDQLLFLPLIYFVAIALTERLRFLDALVSLFYYYFLLCANCARYIFFSLYLKWDVHNFFSHVCA